VAKHADIWHTFGDFATLERKSAILARHRAEVGRDPADIERSAGVDGRLQPGEAGPRLRDLGVTLFTVGVGGPSYDLTRLHSWIEWRDKQNGRPARRRFRPTARAPRGP
jgi:hypothetical protein